MKELDKLRDSMNKNSGSLQGELMNKDEEINKLNKKI